MAFFSRKKNKEEVVPGPARSVTLSDGSVVDIVQQIDCLGDSCPRPQLMTKKALGSAAANEVIEILIDNPSSMEAIPPMMPELGSTHLETIKGNRLWQVYVRKD